LKTKTPQIPEMNSAHCMIGYACGMSCPPTTPQATFPSVSFRSRTFQQKRSRPNIWDAVGTRNETESGRNTQHANRKHK
jgi:hypothetical protein